MASLAKILRLDKVNKKGEAPVYFRIIKHRKVRYIASGVRLEAKYWNERKEVVRTNHKNHKRLNSFLLRKFVELQDKIFEHENDFQIAQHCYAQRNTSWVKLRLILSSMRKRIWRPNGKQVKSANMISGSTFSTS